MPDTSLMPYLFPGWNYEKMTLKELKKVLCSRKVTARGTKDNAISRLRKSDKQAVVCDGIREKKLQRAVKERAAKACQCNGDYKEPVITLELVDQHRTFTRLLDLPPELRNHIYELSFSDIGRYTQGLRCSRQPAVTRASRQLRRESLGLFYATQTLALGVDGTQTDQFGMEEDGARWLTSIRARNVSHIRQFLFLNYLNGYLTRIEITHHSNEQPSVKVLKQEHWISNLKLYGGLQQSEERPRDCLSVEQTQEAVSRCRLSSEAAGADADFVGRLAAATFRYDSDKM